MWRPYRVGGRRAQYPLLLIGERVGAAIPQNFVYLLQEVGPVSRQEQVNGSLGGRLDDPEVARALNGIDVLMPYTDALGLACAGAH